MDGMTMANDDMKKALSLRADRRAMKKFAGRDKGMKRMSIRRAPRYDRLSRMWEIHEPDGATRFTNVPPGAMQQMGRMMDEKPMKAADGMDMGEMDEKALENLKLTNVPPDAMQQMEMGKGPSPAADEDRPALEFKDEEDFDRGLSKLAHEHGTTDDEMDQTLVSEGALKPGDIGEYLNQGMSGMDIKRMIIPKKWELAELLKKLRERTSLEKISAEP